VRVVPPEGFPTGAIAVGYPMRREYHEVAGCRVLSLIGVDLPGGSVEWRNPFPDYPIESDGELSIAQELDSIARAVREGSDPEYGTALGREDHEMGLAADEAAVRPGEKIAFRLKTLTRAEARIHERIRREAKAEPEDVERLVDVAFPWI
jgi:hypothetical protein